jgi:C4-dicarboxylate transporter DctQ subunit
MSPEACKPETMKGASAHRPWYVHIEDVLGTFALGVILIVMAAQIVLRYVFNGSLIWSEEISRYLLIALVFLGTATAVREREHILIDLIDRLIPAKALSVLKVLVDVTLAIYLGVVLYHAQTVVMMFRNQPSSALQVPMAIPYAAIPLGFGLALWRLAGLYLNRQQRSAR